MSIRYRPLQSLQEGRWFKLICGASYQHLPSVRNLALAYALAGADCVDVAADPAVISAAQEAFEAVSALRQPGNYSPKLPRYRSCDRPLLMMSVSDGEDPHFRKAVFDAAVCPPACPRPCEGICPAAAISFEQTPPGVIEDRCYGCGRCLPVCPIQHIDTVTRATPVSAIAPQLIGRVDAIELHTQVGRGQAFGAVWNVIKPFLSQLSLISISCPDHEDVVDYLWQLHDQITPLAVPLIWQTDGRSMSGDIGRGTTHATIRFAQKVLQTGPPGFVQLAGGTNAHTVAKLTQRSAWSSVEHDPFLAPMAARAESQPKPTFGGIAYGSYARQLLAPVLEPTVPCSPAAAFPVEETLPQTRLVSNNLEASPKQLIQAVQLAQSLVAPLKAVRGNVLIPPVPHRGGQLSHMGLPEESPYPSSFE